MYEKIWMDNTPAGWEDKELLDSVKQVSMVLSRDNAGVLFPEPDHTFNAFHLIRPEDVRLVLVDSRPVNGDIGLSFSGQNAPLLDDLACHFGTDISPLEWAKRGVLFLHSTLTKEDGGRSHETLWDSFIARVVRIVCLKASKPLFVLFGFEMPSLLKFKGISFCCGPSTTSRSFYQDLEKYKLVDRIKDLTKKNHLEILDYAPQK